MTEQPTTPASPLAGLLAQRAAYVDGVLRKSLAQAVGMTPDRDWEQLIEGAARLAARAEQAEQEASATATAAAHLTTLVGKRAEQAEAERNRVQEAACRTAENLRRAEARIVRAEERAAAMERAMESTAADALKHRGCHRDLMGQCLRAERAEAALERVRELHQRWNADPGSCAHCHDSYGTPLSYPCPTVQALDQAQQPAGE